MAEACEKHSHDGYSNAIAYQLADGLAETLDRLRAGTDAANRGLPDLAGPLDVLRSAGVLKAVLPSSMGGSALGVASGTARPLADLLRYLGRTDLALARLIEGHINAALLIEVHGDRAVRDAMRARVVEGALLGVWGADGSEPAEWVDRPGEGVALRGSKRYASGLGHVEAAVVTARAAAGAPVRMFFVPTTDPERHDHDSWTASAMRATRSGAFDLNGLVVTESGCVGAAGDLMTEPWFEGGVWRYCAAHVGGAEGLIERWTTHLRRSGRLGDPLQRARLGQAMADVAAARAIVEATAEAVEAVTDATKPAIERAVAHGLLAREATEAACIRVLALAERALGMAAHDSRLPIDGMRRDLSLFLRQAGPDAKLDRAVGVVSDVGLGQLR